MSIKEETSVPWTLLEEQRRIIEDQRSVIEEQRRIIKQSRGALLTPTTVPASDLSETSSIFSAGSRRSLPLTSVSSGSVEHGDRNLPGSPSRAVADLATGAEAVPNSPATPSDPWKKLSELGWLSPSAAAAATEQWTSGGLSPKSAAEDFRLPYAARRSADSELDCAERSLGTLAELGGLSPAATATTADQWPSGDFAPTVPETDFRMPRASRRSVDAELDCSLKSLQRKFGGSTKLDETKVLSPLSRDSQPAQPVFAPSTDLADLVLRQVQDAAAVIVPPTPPSSAATAADAGSVVREMWRVNLDSWALRANICSHGKWLCTASENKTARIYEIASKSQLQCLQHDGWVWSAQFSPDGVLLCTASGDGLARIFDAETGAAMHRLPHRDVVRAASFDASGRLLLTASQDKSARLFDSGSGRLAREIEHSGWVLAAAWGPEGRRFCTASDDLCARLFDAETGQQGPVLEHGDWVRSVEFCPDGKRLGTASDDKCVRIFDLSSKTEITKFEHAGAVSSASFSPDGNWLCTACDDNYAYIFDMVGNKELTKLKHGGRVCSASFSPDGRQLCTSSEDGYVRIFGYALQSVLSLIRMTRTQ